MMMIMISFPLPNKRKLNNASIICAVMFLKVWMANYKLMIYFFSSYCLVIFKLDCFLYIV